jgi:hypothetical protein
LDADSDADEAERSILRAGVGAEPPPGLEDELFRRVLAAPGLPATFGSDGAGAGVAPVGPLPTASVGGAAAAGGTAKAVSTLALLGKGFVAGVGVSVAVAAGQHWVTRAPVRADATHHTVQATEPRALQSAARVAAPAPVIALPASAALAPNTPVVVSDTNPTAPRLPRKPGESARKDAAAPLAEEAVASRPASQLEEEAALLKAARQQLRHGALAAAFATLETSRQRFSPSALGQEREALMIELLYRSGQRAAAAARARAFLDRHAESPHRGQVQKFAE